MSRGILLTGSASGIGLKLTRDLQREGYRLLASDLDGPALEQRFAAEGWASSGITFESLDVTDYAAWQRVLERGEQELGGIDALINVAGFIRAGNAQDTSEADIHRTIDVNLKGVIFGTSLGAQLMTKRKRGHIVNIASMAGIAPVPGISVYCASKQGVRGFTLAAAQELAPLGVAVTCVCPGLVDTPMLDAQVGHDEAAFTFSAPRALSTEEISAAVMRALQTRPLEVIVAVPYSGQALAAKLSSAMPSATRLLQPLVRYLGRRNQDKLRKARS